MSEVVIVIVIVLTSSNIIPGIYSSGGKFGGVVTLAVVVFRTFTLAVVLAQIFTLAWYFGKCFTLSDAAAADCQYGV